MKAIRIAIVLALVLGALSMAGSALAQGSGEQPPTEVQGGGFPSGQEGPTEVGPGIAPSELGGPQGGVLPFTGAQLVGFTAVGTLAVAAGATLVRRARPRQET